jgi:hypothetical protein
LSWQLDHTASFRLRPKVPEGQPPEALAPDTRARVTATASDPNRRGQSGGEPAARFFEQTVKRIS